MDIQRTSIISRLSSSNNRNSGSVMSLQRVSSVRNSSLTRRISLVNAMDLQGSLHSNRTGKDSILGMDDSRRQSLFRSSHKEKQGYSYQPDIQEEDLNRKSQFQITHECYCTEEECVGQHCSCYLTPREICVIGQCCDRCLAAKNQFLKQTRGFQLEKDYAELQLKEQQHQLAQLLREKNCKNMHYFKQIHANQPCMKGVVFCTCKKSHCQKKYCLCFEKGVKCGEFCKCLECQNTKDEDQEFQEEQKRRWERYGTYKRYDQQDNIPHMQIDIQQYLGERNSNEFPKAMQFQPPNFDHVPYQ